MICTVKNNTYRRYPGLLGTLKHKMATAGIARVDHFIAASRMVADLYADRFGVDASLEKPFDIREIMRLAKSFVGDPRAED